MDDRISDGPLGLSFMREELDTVEILLDVWCQQAVTGKTAFLAPTTTVNARLSFQFEMPLLVIEAKARRSLC